jgi:2-keto-4-pentenoate hydratase
LEEWLQTAKAVKAGSRLHADYGPLGTIDLEFV